MNTSELLDEATKTLQSADIPTARLDSLVLLEDATGKDRSWLLAHPESALPASFQGPSLERLREQIARRARHEPLAYIRGKSEFYGREFIVSPQTLEPRPESETMIDLLKKLIGKHQSKDKQQKTSDYIDNLRIVDVGTGSGCLAITAKLEYPDAEVFGTDIEPGCIKVATKNAEKLHAKVAFLQGNLLYPLLKNEKLNRENIKSSILLANLPYVPDSYQLNEAAQHEPRRAIFGGEDGLDLYRKLFQQLEGPELTASHIFTESLPFQHEALNNIADSYGYKQIACEDFICVFSASK